jgi:FkbM family methyltransferase
MDWLKKIFSKLPRRVQQEMKRLHFRHQARVGTLDAGEPEYDRLAEWITDGDWVVDVGANVGHYTVRLSQLVGARGRVIAFEPVLDTFELLASNVAAAGARNVSLFNTAVSAQTAAMGMAMPRFDSGLKNYYMAALTPKDSEFQVLTMTLDSIDLPTRVALVKIDVEGHELQALQGMQSLLRRDHPRLIIEGVSDEVHALLNGLNYDFLQLPGSPNRVFFPRPLET